jgi:hypothetical protein
MCVPGDTSPLTYVSPCSMTFDDEYLLSHLDFLDYASEVKQVLLVIQTKLTGELRMNAALEKKVGDLKELND